MLLFQSILILSFAGWLFAGTFFDIACIGQKGKCPFGPRAASVGLYRLVRYLTVKPAAVVLRWAAQKINPVAGPDEILPGVQKPSSVLTDMICAQLLRPDVEHSSRDSYSGRYTYGIVKTDKVYVEHDNDFRKDRVHALSVYTIKVNGVAVNLSNDEEHRIKVALHRAEDFRKKKLIADAEADRQNKALDAINAFMGVNKDIKDGKDSSAV